MEQHMMTGTMILQKVGAIGIYDEDSEKNWIRSQKFSHRTQRNQSATGKYKYYLSTNKDADESLKKVEKMNVTLTEDDIHSSISAFDCQP